MVRLARALSWLAALLSAALLLRAPGGWRRMLLAVPKSLGGIFAPWLVVLGGVGALVSLRYRNWRAAAAALFGAVAAARHVRLVTAPHDGFGGAFGAGWRNRIHPDLRARLAQPRYSPLPAALPDVPWQRDLVVGIHHQTGEPLLADLWLPPDGVPRTGLAVIYLHGSGWHYLDKDFWTRSFFRRLAAQGHIIVDLAYTMAPKADLLAMVADVKRAIVWAKTRGASHGIRPDRVVLMGGSAGGQLALQAGYTPNHPDWQPADVQGDTTVRGVVSYYGVTDLKASHLFFAGQYGHVLPTSARLPGRLLVAALEWLFHRTRILPPYGRYVGMGEMVPDALGGTPAEKPDLYRDGSPINHVGPHCPPTLVLQGTHDVAGMMPDVRRLHRRLRAAGVPAVLVEFPNTEHGFDLFFPRIAPAAQAAAYDTEHFLALMV